MVNITCWLLLALAYIVLLATTPTIATKLIPSDLEGCNITDITHTLQNGIASFDSDEGAGEIINEKYGNHTIVGRLQIGTHLGTHVDAPSHIYKNLLKEGFTADALDLRTLIGPVLVVETPTNDNITAEVLASLKIPEGTKRVIFKTSNTHKQLMNRTAFAEDYTGFTEDGARWFVKNNSSVKFVGIDYMSIATKKDVVPVHRILLKNKDIIPVENLKLDKVEPGPYTVYCLPLNLLAEASPVRCILAACC